MLPCLWQSEEFPLLYFSSYWALTVLAVKVNLRQTPERIQVHVLRMTEWDVDNQVVKMKTNWLCRLVQSVFHPSGRCCLSGAPSLGWCLEEEQKRTCVAEQVLWERCWLFESFLQLCYWTEISSLSLTLVRLKYTITERNFYINVISSETHFLLESSTSLETCI